MNELDRINNVNKIINKFNFPKSVNGEVMRLGIYFCDPTYIKKYRIMNFEQLEAICAWYDSLNITDEDITQFHEDENREFDKYRKLSIYFGKSEEGFEITDSDTWEGILVETSFVKELRQWLIENNKSVELNTGMVQFVSCMIESYV